jgi:hypothetical protein
MNQQQKLDQIELKLDDLTAKQLALQKNQTIYQRLFASDPELVSVTTQIARLEKQRGRIYDILQVSYITNIRQLLQYRNQSQRKTGPKRLFIPRH